MTDSPARQAYRDVMTVDAPAAATALEQATLDFVFGQVWARPGLTRRERRWVTLACVGAADSPAPIEDHVYAALNSGDISLPELLEFALHFAVYCGWPKASHFEGVTRRQWARVHEERGEPTPPFPLLAAASLGDNDWERRLARGEEEFRDVNFVPAPPRDSPYQQAGILNFVFGHVWQRPGLARRDRRLITVACVGVDDSPIPIQSHVTSALKSGDLSLDEMRELILQFAAYSGFAKAEALDRAATQAWAGITAERAPH